MINFQECLVRTLSQEETMDEAEGPWIEIWEVCEVCNGTGRDPKAANTVCPKCHQMEGE